MKTRIFLLALSLVAFTHSFAQNQFSKQVAPVATIHIEDDETILAWSVAIEVNTSFFVIEESLDNGASFAGIRTVKATGNSTLPTHFEINEFGFIKTNATYRVVLVQMDGLRIASNEVKLKPRTTILPNTPIAKK